MGCKWLNKWFGVLIVLWLLGYFAYFIIAGYLSHLGWQFPPDIGLINLSGYIVLVAFIWTAAPVVGVWGYALLAEVIEDLKKWRKKKAKGE